MDHRRPCSAPSRPIRALHRAGSALLLSALAASCASSGGDGAYEGPVGRRAGTVGIANSQGFVGFLDIETDAAVRQTTVSASPSDVWSVLPDVLEALDVPLETFDAMVLAIGNTNFSPRRIEGRRMSRYLDCGTNLGRANADRYRVSMYLMLKLDPEGDATALAIVMEAYARPMDVAGNAVHCTSRGRLEDRIEELVQERL